MRILFLLLAVSGLPAWGGDATALPAAAALTGGQTGVVNAQAKTPVPTPVGNTDPAKSLPSANATLASCGQINDALATRLAMARQTLDSGKGYAALAYLDALNSQMPESQLIRADALRRIGQIGSAETLYQQLSRTCLAGYAFRGLGLIESARSRQDEAVRYLERAQGLLPLYATLRNDMGYLYMKSGNYPAAKFAFMTAIELDPSDRRPLHNLIVVLARQGDPSGARQLASEAGVSESDLATLFARAGLPTVAQGDSRVPSRP